MVYAKNANTPPAWLVKGRPRWRVWHFRKHGAVSKFKVRYCTFQDLWEMQCNPRGRQWCSNMRRRGSSRQCLVCLFRSLRLWVQQCPTQKLNLLLTLTRPLWHDLHLEFRCLVTNQIQHCDVVAALLEGIQVNPWNVCQCSPSSCSQVSAKPSQLGHRGHATCDCRRLRKRRLNPAKTSPRHGASQWKYWRDGSVENLPKVSLILGTCWVKVLRWHVVSRSEDPPSSWNPVCNGETHLEDSSGGIPIFKA